MTSKLLLFPSGKPRINVGMLYVPFVCEILEVLAACSARGVDYYPYCGHRTYAESGELYEKWVTGKGGRAAPPGASQHNFGLAVDVAPDGDMAKTGLQPDWRDAAYVILGEEVAKRPRLHWGNSYNDSPHVGWADFVSRPRITILDSAWRRNFFEDGETKDLLVKYVWPLVDEHSRV